VLRRHAGSFEDILCGMRSILERYRKAIWGPELLLFAYLLLDICGNSRTLLQRLVSWKMMMRRKSLMSKPGRDLALLAMRKPGEKSATHAPTPTDNPRPSQRSHFLFLESPPLHKRPYLLAKLPPSQRLLLSGSAGDWPPRQAS